VSDLRAETTVSWTQKDDALPMPLDMKDAVLQLALRASDVVETLDQQPLRVTGLTAPHYTLKIDGETVGSFTPEQLAAGINLATLPTPMATQAGRVHGLTVNHNNIHFARWRQVQVPLQDNPSRQIAPALKSLDALDDDLARQQRDAAQPKPHHYELAPE
jgi:hypothetical protein